MSGNLSSIHICNQHCVVGKRRETRVWISVARQLWVQFPVEWKTFSQWPKMENNRTEHQTPFSSPEGICAKPLRHTQVCIYHIHSDTYTITHTKTKMIQAWGHRKLTKYNNKNINKHLFLSRLRADSWPMLRWLWIPERIFLSNICLLLWSLPQAREPEN